MPRRIEPPVSAVPDAAVSHGCFETMRAYQGRIFRLDAHLDRLYASAAFLGTRAPADRGRLGRQLVSALARSGLGEAVVRVALLPRPDEEARPSIVVQPAIAPSAAAYRRGLRVAVVPARKFSVGSITPQAKYSARLGSVLAVADAQLRNADEALFMDALGGVTESTASNLGIAARGELVTPPCWLGLLAGITREALLDLGPAVGLPVREAPLTRHDLYTADEVFLMSTLKEFIAVTRVDGRRIGTGRPGPVTGALRAAFRALVRRELGLGAGRAG